MKNSNFKIEFIWRYNDYSNTIFKLWNVIGHMDIIYNEMIPLRKEHIQRYPQSWKKSEVSDLKKWAQERPEKARKEIANYFGYKSMVNVTFRCNQEQRALGVNALLIDEKSDMCIDNAWECSVPYYKNLPIWLCIIPSEGY